MCPKYINVHWKLWTVAVKIISINSVTIILVIELFQNCLLDREDLEWQVVKTSI